MILRSLALLSVAAFAADEKPVAALGPYVRFTGPETAIVRWETATEQIGAVEFGSTSGFGSVATEPKPTKRHEVTLNGLKRGAVYFYRLKFGDFPGETLTLETEFNFARAPLPDVMPFGENEDAAAVAQRILQQTAENWDAKSALSRKGYALLLGDDGSLAWEIARRSDMSVVAVHGDAEAVARGRNALDAVGAYGNRVQVLFAPTGKLPHADALFDLVAIVTVPQKFTESARVLRPGGTLWFGNSIPDDGIAWLLNEDTDVRGRVTLRDNGAERHPDVLMVRNPVAGGGAWSHAYGDAGQSANSGDTTVHGRGLSLRWFGEPGARGMMDRQPRSPPPLCVNGTFFIQGNDRLFALDASNGAFLWSLEVPGLRRVNIPRDCSNVCADAQRLYVAVRDRVWWIDARSGEVRKSFTVEEAARGGAQPDAADVKPANSNGDSPRHHWGYVGFVDAPLGGQLFGSTIKPGANYTRFEGGDEFWYDAHNARSTSKVLSDSLFAWRTNGVSPGTWTHKPRGLVINPTISIGGGRMYFIESRGLGALDSTPGRVESPALYKDAWLVAIDTATGALMWEKEMPIAPLGTAEVLYLCYASETLVLLDSARGTYYSFAYSAKDGAELWRRAQPWVRDHHGGHLYHPVLVQGMAVVEPFGYDLITGEIRLRNLPERGGCTTLSAAAECLHFINWDYDKGSMYVRDFSDGKTRQFSGSRGNCWLSFISGSGMLMLPAASGGCSCRYPNQVTLGFATEGEAEQ